MRLWLDRWAARRLIRRIHEHADHAKTDDELTVEAALWVLAGEEQVALRLFEARSVHT